MQQKVETEKEIQETRAREKNARKIKKIGKPMMMASEKPSLKKIEVKKKELTEDQEAEL